MADVSFANTIINAANRHRLNADVSRARKQEKLTSDITLETKTAEVVRRDQIAAEITLRSAQAIRDRRDDTESNIERGSKLKGQQRVLDSIDNDTQYRRVRDDIAAELNIARDDESAILALIDSEAEEALALDSVDQFRNDLNSRPEIQTFLTQRDQRLAVRQQQDRDFQVQQRIDLRISDDNVNSINPGSHLARGSIVDVSG